MYHVWEISVNKEVTHMIRILYYNLQLLTCPPFPFPKIMRIKMVKYRVIEKSSDIFTIMHPQIFFSNRKDGKGVKTYHKISDVFQNDILKRGESQNINTLFIRPIASQCGWEVLKNASLNISRLLWSNFPICWVLNFKHNIEIIFFKLVSH